VPGSIFHVGAQAICPHGGQVAVLSSNTRVFVGVQQVATTGDGYPVTGCPFVNAANVPQPCVLVRWSTPATRVFVNGQPVLLNSSTGVTQNAAFAPQGLPLVTGTQTRVSAT
jgi:hypothetical protein